MNSETVIIIPSAKLVPEELQNLGKLPAIIYPINQKTVFEHLYEKYKNNTIKVICHQAADKVHRRLKKYESNIVKIEDLPTLGDLGSTIYYGIRDITSPIVINFADTIVLDDLDGAPEDAFFYSEDYMSDVWTFFEEENGVITSIYDKVSIEPEKKRKLFVGVFKLSDVVYFKICLERALGVSVRKESSFYYALKEYSLKYPMVPISANEWYDIGHAGKYYDTKLAVKAREFNHIIIDKERGILKKTSKDKEKFIGEIKWYLKIPADIEYVRPRIFNYSTSYNEPFVSMEYYAYHTIHELFLYGDLSFHQWMDLFNRIRFVCNDFKRYTVSDINIKSALEDMYLTKTIERLERLKADKNFANFFVRPILINGVNYKSLNEVIGILKEMIPLMLYDVEKFNVIHGDLCFTNIMVDANLSFIKVIDPRGKFGPYDIYGDFRYELAKLFHSVDGKYDFIIKDLFEVDYDLINTEIQYSIIERKRSYDLYKVFTNVFSEEIGDNLKKIELIEALLFLSMIPLHGENLNHQVIMLATGLEILGRVCDITK